MGKIKLLIKYIVYRIVRTGAGGHGIHSPFVYEFNRKVLNSRIYYDEYAELNEYRNRLVKRREIIEVCDHGAGSQVFSSSLRRISDIAKHAGSSRKTGRMIFRLARHLKADVSVELGTSLGLGTICLARGSATGKVYSIEACPIQHRLASYELAGAGIENVELINGSFNEKLPELLGKLDKLDIVYFDGDHRKESVVWQFTQCLAKVSADTVFVVGDINWSPGMNEAWKIIINDQRVSFSVDLFYCGLVFFRKGMARQHFKLRF
jgi:predicted O-methyltransferase YrrM